MWWNKRRPQRWLLNLTMIGLVIAIGVGFFVGGTTVLPLNVQAFILVTLIGVALGGYLIVIYAMMGNVVDYDEMLTGRRREAIYYGTFSFAIGLGSSVGTLILPLFSIPLDTRAQNPLGVRVAFLVMALFVFIGYLIFQTYQLGDTPEETRRNMKMD